MLKSHVNFHSTDGKRRILIVDDEVLNREMLGFALQDDYEILYAGNGLEALQLIRSQQEPLSLILLDLMMPEMSGLELLSVLKQDPSLSKIPVIVLTAEQSAEVESLQSGAIDFIPKPYPKQEIVKARIVRTIELSEDRQTIQSTERDRLTNLYTREYFFRYADQYDQYHQDQAMDAILIDVNHFHMINERYGRAYGDQVLKDIGTQVRDMVRDSGGIVCRRENDTFLVYCPHRTDYQQMFDTLSDGLIEADGSVNSRVRLRMGVYSNVDKKLDIERCFDRAKMAADTVRNSFTKTIGIYDSALRESEIYSEQLLEDFGEAIASRQFRVYYQPKMNIRGKEPVLASAEALIRWQHPSLGMISPGQFIPLFEKNGLIQKLDQYVWQEAAAQIRRWKDQYGLVVPVSVNVSRVDMYDPNLVETLQSIMESHRLTPRQYLLEITESAYTEDSSQIIDTVNELRSLGFRIEMDDFGTGYSSLGMISRLPIDALKLDMTFVRNAFNEKKDVRMLELIIDIADYLSVPVIAEGVETQEQLSALRDMGCDIVQGYFFSKPVPAEEFARFIEDRIAYEKAALEEPIDLRMSPMLVSPSPEPEEQAYKNIAHALSSGFESIYYVDTSTNAYVEFASRGKYEELKIQRSGSDFFADTQVNLKRVAYEDDLAMVARAMDRDTLLSALEDDRIFTLTYRLMIEGQPVWYNLKAVRTKNQSDPHIVVGVNNVDEQMRQAIEYRESRSKNIEFYNIAQALSSDFESIYYVNTKTDDYTEFTAQGSYEDLQIMTSGSDFFAESQTNLLSVVYKEDQDRVSAFLDKNRLLMDLRRNSVMTLDYRLLINGEPVYYRMKVVPAESGTDDHVVIGVSNVNSQMKQSAELAAAQKDSLTYARIAQILAQDYFSIYYVNTVTDDFIEYSSTGEYQQLQIEQSGSDFFADSRRNIMRVVYEEDREKALAIWDKDYMMRSLENDSTYSTSYRLLMNGQPVYINIKVMKLVDGDDRHIVVGISNIDAQMQREKEFAQMQAAAFRDALTGVKNKRAYSQDEEKLNAEIEDKAARSFAIVVCDVNGLKEVNDTLGHKAGDRFIRDACSRICHIFMHSPVYRIGGDEFVVILRNQDYENRQQLMEDLAGANAQTLADNALTPDRKVVIANGMSEFVPGRDTAVSSVFERADTAMYENKKHLKAGR